MATPNGSETGATGEPPGQRGRKVTQPGWIPGAGEGRKTRSGNPTGKIARSSRRGSAARGRGQAARPAREPRAAGRSQDRPADRRGGEGAPGVARRRATGRPDLSARVGTSPGALEPEGPRRVERFGGRPPEVSRALLCAAYDRRRCAGRVQARRSTRSSGASASSRSRCSTSPSTASAARASRTSPTRSASPRARSSWTSARRKALFLAAYQRAVAAAARVARRARGDRRAGVLGDAGLVARAHRGVRDLRPGAEPDRADRPLRHGPRAAPADRPVHAERGPVRHARVRGVRRAARRGPRRRRRGDARLDAGLARREVPGRARLRGPRSRADPPAARAARRCGSRSSSRSSATGHRARRR